MKPISLVRFNALAGYARMPRAVMHAEELRWFELTGGHVVGTVIRDREDGDYGGIAFAQDQKLRFRAVDVTEFEPSQRRAEVALRRAMERASMAPDEAHHQGDEQGPPVDFFAYTRERYALHSDFRQLADSEAYSPAKCIIEPMMRWYEDADGNFVEQFQTAGFDQRIWELYLFAAFTEMGYLLDRTEAVPDFSCSGLVGQFTAEAVTVGPTRAGREIIPPPPVKTAEEKKEFLRNYMPIKFGSALYSKLRRNYWERQNVQGKPFVLAIEDFSSPGSMIQSAPALHLYLYGYDHDAEQDSDGNLTITPRKVDFHQWGDKVIPSGFFDLPDAENVSAVIFSNSGTIAKFNRMGILGGFGSDRVLAIREGTCVDHDPNAITAKPFRHIVNAADYSESWSEGLSVFHNPRALIPLPKHFIEGAAHHFLQDDGQILTETPEWHPHWSVTKHLFPVDVETMMRNMAGEAG